MTTVTKATHITIAAANTVPINVQVILQGQNAPVATSSAGCVTSSKGGGKLFEPNYCYIGWHSVPGASGYNVYRSTNGGAYTLLGSSPTITASAAGTNWTNYVALYPAPAQTFGNYIATQSGPASGCNCAYYDTAATGIIGSGGQTAATGSAGAAGADFVGTASITNNSTTIVLTGVTGGVAAFGSLVGGSGYTPGTYTLSNSQTLSGGTGTGCKPQIVVGGGGSVTAVYIFPTATQSGGVPGSGYTVGDVLTVNNAYVGGTGSGFSITVTANIVPGQGIGTLAGASTITTPNNSTPVNPSGLPQTSAAPGSTSYIPLGTLISSGSGGNGTYTMSQAATSTQSGIKIGAVMWGNTGYTYYVTAIVSGVESSASAYAYLPFVINGNLVLCNGAFDSYVGTQQTAPTPSPLGYTTAVDWNPGPGHQSFFNAFSGNGSVNYNLNTMGYNYINISFCPTISGLAPGGGNAEICGDAPLLYPSATGMEAYGPSSWTQNQWNTYKMPISIFNTDATSSVLQSAMYKITWGLNNDSPPASVVYCEYWFSVT